MTKPATDLISAPVWDGFVRVFHWSLVALFVISVITGKVGGNAIAWHMWSGYAILALVLFRILWGFVGGEYARYGSFLSSPGRAFRFAKGLMGKTHEYVVGHNPVGGWMVLALLLLLATQAVLGLFSNDEIEWFGPLSERISVAVSADWTDWHHLGQKLLLGLIVLHLLAIAGYKLVRRVNLVTPMLTGRKQSEDSADAHWRSPWLALGLFLACAAAVAAIAWWGPMPAAY